MIGRKRHMLLVQLYVTNESLLLDYPSWCLSSSLWVILNTDTDSLKDTDTILLYHSQ